MARLLTRAMLRTITQDATLVCRSCGRPIIQPAAVHTDTSRRGSASHKRLRRERAHALRSPGNPDVMRKFLELQSKARPDDFDDDDFADDKSVQGPGVGELSSADDRSGINTIDGTSGPQIILPEELPPPKATRVHSARYVKSSVQLSACPKGDLPEFAVIGRSNVGKSSLINMLTNSKNLALVSKQPGYGYAKSAKENRLKWNAFTKEYFLNRETLVMVLLLVDATITPQQVDLACAGWLSDAEVPYAIVFTKVDKRKKGHTTQANMDSFLHQLEEETSELPESFVTSALEKIGGRDVMGFLSSLRQLFEREAASPS